jgi:DivIVA domain-containing protein
MTTSSSSLNCRDPRFSDTVLLTRYVEVEHKRGTIDRVMWVWVVVIVALAGGVVAVAVGRGGSMSEVYDDRPDASVPSGRPLTSDDLRDVRFSTAVRGYRMDEVDALLSRIRADLIARESAPPDETVQVVDPAGAHRAADRDARAVSPDATDAGVVEAVDPSAAGSSPPTAEDGASAPATPAAAPSLPNRRLRDRPGEPPLDHEQS